MTSSNDSIVRVEDFTVDYLDQRKWVNIANRISFAIEPGETLGLAGESGCGKSTMGFSLFGYRRPGSRVRSGRVHFEGLDLLKLSERELRSIRGPKIFMVPQNPASTLTPSMRVGRQVVETLMNHKIVANRKEAEAKTLQIFEQVGLPRPDDIFRRYPHELSGGQQQRVVIAIALACQPKLVVMDEPTTALDVTTQARILRLLDSLKVDYGMSILFITHNLGVLAQICDRVAVMYAGEMAEVAPTAELFKHPRHPYTRGLIAAVPQLNRRNDGKEKLEGLLRRGELPNGCRFAPRCRYADPKCFSESQTLTTVGQDHQAACWRWEHVKEATR
jgi:peptide/nickel transport system ATP-binding protein